MRLQHKNLSIMGMMDICMALHANKELLDHYIETFNGEVIGVLHPYQFAIDEVNAKKIMEVYDYDWTDEEI